MEAVRERWTDDRMDDLVVRVDNGFARVDKQFEQVDKRFEQVDARFAQVDNRFAELRAEQIDIRKGLSEKATRQELSNLESAMNQRFDRLQNMLLTGFLTLLILTLVPQIT